jgi:hypothetical protein
MNLYRADVREDTCIRSSGGKEKEREIVEDTGVDGRKIYIFLVTRTWHAIVSEGLTIRVP